MTATALSTSGLRNSRNLWIWNIRFWLNSLIVLLLLSTLAACGSGGSGEVASTALPGTATGANSGGAPPAPGATPGAGNASDQVDTLTVELDNAQTSPGGPNIILTALSTGTTDIEWTLAPGNPGSLSRNTGNSVEYIPPPAGAVAGDSNVNIIVRSGNRTETVTIVLSAGQSGNTGTPGAGTVTPPVPDDSGAPSTGAGIFLVAGNDFGAGMINGTGTAARFDTPIGIARDKQGNLYIADSGNNVVRKINADGEVTTLAGTPGERGYADGTGAEARFSAISGIAVDRAGNIYVADHGNALIRKISPDGTVTTLAGAPGSFSSTDGPRSEARFGGQPMSLAVDSKGNLYVAETLVVRRIAPDGTVSTIAGRANTPGTQNGPAANARFTRLNGIAIDNAGNIYVTDSGMEREGGIMSRIFFISAAIRKIATDGTVSTLAGTGREVASGDVGNVSDVIGFADGEGAQARFRFIDGLTIDASGNLFVADRDNRVIRKVTPEGVVTTVAGVPGQAGSVDGPIADARFRAPNAVTVDPDGVLYVTDDIDHTVRRVVPGVNVTTLAGAAPRSGSSDGTRFEALFNNPQGISRDAQGNLYVADSGNNTIRRIGRNGMVSTIAGTPGQTGSANGVGAAALFNLPLDVAIDGLGDIFVADFSNRLIRRVTPDGVVSTYAGMAGQNGYRDGPALMAQFVEPRAVAFDQSGNLYVADRAGDAVRKITPQGVVSTLIRADSTNPQPIGLGDGRQLFFPHDIAVDRAGNVYVIDSGSAIRKITPDGVMTTLAGAPFQHGSRDGIGTAARFNQPQSLALDEDGNIYVADSRAIRKISPLGVVTTVAGATQTALPASLRNIDRPQGLVVTGPRTLAFTSGNGVFEVRLP